ncbi:hypothetical protein AAY473_010337 [Plecturocebus cupreus]
MQSNVKGAEDELLNFAQLPFRSFASDPQWPRDPIDGVHAGQLHGTIVAGIIEACHHAWLIFVFVVETGFRHVARSGLELLTSGDLSTLAPKVLGLQA